MKTYVIHDNRGYVTGLSLDPNESLAFDHDPHLAAKYENLSMAQNDSRRMFPGSAVLTYEMAVMVWQRIAAANGKEGK